jgi:glycosyltransferase involved in cell wall biosynthesis
MPGQPKNLRVLFGVRADLRSVGGGDATQILRTKDALEALGVQVVLWDTPRPPSGSFDLAHLFHLTRLDTFVQARALERAHLPFVLSTIYWPTSELEQHGYVGALRLAHAALASGPAEMAKSGVRALRAGSAWWREMLPAALVPLGRRIDYLIHHSRCLLPNSLAEADVVRLLGATRIAPIVNATDPPPSPRPPSAQLPPRFVLCVGRIEPRKNQLALVQALEHLALPLVIVGDPGPLHHDYARRVHSAAGSGVLLLGARPRSELFSLYAAAEAHVAPAWYETPGLVSLEAAAAGTRVVTTDRGCTREYFKDQAFYLDPSDPESMRSAVEQALASLRDPSLRERVLRDFTWEKAAEQTLAAYQGALAGAVR